MAGSTRYSPLKLLLWSAGALIFGYIAAGIYVAGLDTVTPPANSNRVVINEGCARGERIKGRSWTACYGHILTTQDQTVVDLDDVTQGVIYKKNKPYLHVTATHITVNTLTHDFAAAGKIHIETADPDQPHRTFETDSATWSDAAQRLVLPHKSIFETGAEQPLIVGSVTLDVKTGQVEMKDVSGEADLNSK